jgi:Flp pilus assembly protein TadD
LLLQTAALAGADRATWLRVLEDSISRHHGDLNLHQRYAETLLADGRIADAIVEAKLMLRIDPYNFRTTLFLASAYFEAQLYDECEAVCNGYLMVAGYCYEFRDLMDRRPRSCP